MDDVVTMTHPRMGERQVHRDVVGRMEQNGWTVKTQKAEASKSKSSKESE